MGEADGHLPAVVRTAPVDDVDVPIEWSARDAVVAALDGRDVLLVVGPEGGITDHEVEALTGAGARAVRLGSTILRASSAGPAATAKTSSGPS